MARVINLLLIISWPAGILPASALLASDTSEPQVAFPAERPPNANFNRPADGAVLDISPPGFCWWRAGLRDAVHYQLTIRSGTGHVVYQSPVLADPVHVPAQVLPAGNYSWTVSALIDNRVAATLGPRGFRILENPFALPWVPPGDLLLNVPAAHPRLLFPADQRDEFRATLTTTRKQPYTELRAIAERALALELMPKPTFDRFDRETQYAQRRVAYRESYHQFTDLQWPSERLRFAHPPGEGAILSFIVSALSIAPGSPGSHIGKHGVHSVRDR